MPNTSNCFLTLHDDGQITFGEGVTAEDRCTEIRFFKPDGQTMVAGWEAEIVYRAPGQPERRERQIPVLRQALADDPIPVTRWCFDCAAAPGERHDEGCAVARCTVCGFQRIACDCEGGQPTVWTGRYPGLAEVEKYGYSDLNDLAARAHQGLMIWDSATEQWKTKGQQS